MIVRQLYDDTLAHFTYLVGCEATGEAVLFDPVRHVERYFRVADRVDLTIVAAADTHLHADYLTGLRELSERGVTVYASGEGGSEQQYEWLQHSPLPHRLLADGDVFPVGDLVVEALHTPGHAPEHLCYLIRTASGEAPAAVATGDLLFVEGAGRPNLESVVQDSGAASTSDHGSLLHSMQVLYDLPASTEVWPLHRKGTLCGHAPSSWPVSTIGRERKSNPFLRAVHDESAFDRALDLPFPVPSPYFTRMKHLNRIGPPRLDDVPVPKRVTGPEVVNLIHSTAVVFLDTRRDCGSFMARHLPRALHAPLGDTFLPIVGTYVDPGTPIYVVGTPATVEKSVAALLRIGLDDVAGWLPPSMLNHLPSAHLTSTPTLHFDDVATLSVHENVVVVDVRFPDRFAAGHVRGALNLPYTQLPHHVSTIPDDATVLVYSEHGRLATAAASYLERRGYHVANVYDAFQNAVSHVDTTSPPKDA